MGTYDDIRSTRRLVLVGAWLGLAASTAGLVLFLINVEFATGSVLGMVAWVAVLAVPSMWAFRSLDRRPTLLPAAAMGALVVGLVELFVFVPPVHLIAALVFWLAARRRPAPGAPVASWKRPLMAATLVLPALVMSSHLDPVCTTVGADGTTETTQVGEGGWSLGLGGSSSSTTASSSSGFDAVETTTCSSDTTVWWEGVAGLAVALAVALPGVRWPANLPARSVDTLNV